MSYACKVYEGLIGLDFVRYHAMRKEVGEKEVCVITRTILLQSEFGFQHEKRLLFVNRIFVNVYLVADIITRTYLEFNKR